MLTPNLPGWNVFRDAVRRAAELSPLVDLGTPSRFHKELSGLRNEFEATRYFAFRYHPTRDRPDHIDGYADAQKPPFRADSVGAVLMLEVLEHLASPTRAVREIHRCLRKDGVVIATVPFLRGWHGKNEDPAKATGDHYPDYWRFTHDGLRHLFSSFRETQVTVLTGFLGDRLERLGDSVLQRCLARLCQRSLMAELDVPHHARRLLLLAIK